MYVTGDGEGDVIMSDQTELTRLFAGPDLACISLCVLPGRRGDNARRGPSEYHPFTLKYPDGSYARTMHVKALLKRGDKVSSGRQQNRHWAIMGMRTATMSTLVNRLGEYAGSEAGGARGLNMGIKHRVEGNCTYSCVTIGEGDGPLRTGCRVRHKG